MERKPFYWLNDVSRTFLQRGYLLEGETAEQRLKDICTTAERISGFKGFAETFYDHLSKGHISLSTPVWTNFGRSRGMPVSCFNSHVSDNVGSILYATAEIGMMSKLGGGTSAYLGDLRPRGSEITDNGYSTGTVSFLPLYETATNVISQGCYDDQTDILTEQGWMSFEDLLTDKSIKVAQVEDDKTVSFVQPSDYIKYEVDEALLHFKDADNIDLLVTKNHNMVFEKQVNHETLGICMSNILETTTAEEFKPNKQYFMHKVTGTVDKDTILSDVFSTQNLQITEVPYKGYVYCVTVPSHRLIVRRNGKQVVCGNSARRGRVAPYLPVDHKDIDEFLDVATDGHEIQDLNHGVVVTDEWMTSMVEGDKEKRKIWAKLLKRRKEIGFPYILFKDTANRDKPQVYKDKNYTINSSNLCVTGDTKVLTKEGYKEIRTLAGQQVECWNGKEWSLTAIAKTSDAAKVLKVVTSHGQILEVTPEHKWYVYTDTGDIQEKRTHELKCGDKLIEFSLEPAVHGTKHLHNAYELGFSTDKDTLSKDSVPSSEYSMESRLLWLAGYLDANSIITDISNVQSVQITSKNIESLQNVQLLLQELGVFSSISSQKFEDVYTLVVEEGLEQLLILGLPTKKITIKSSINNKHIHSSNTVVAIVDEGKEVPTYCGNEPKEHKLVFNGVLTGNCSEIMLPSTEEESFTCVLSSVNLLHYEEWKDSNLIELMIIFLDSVAEEFIQKLERYRDSDSSEDRYVWEFMKRTYNFTKRHRALGLGVLGWHSLLQSNMIAFDSKEAAKLNLEIFKNIREQADAATEKLAKVLGEPEVLKGYGRRNTTTLAIAPTTSSAAILGQVSQSIEPFMSNYYIKDMAKVKTVVKNPYLEKVLEDKGHNTAEVWDMIASYDGSVQNLPDYVLTPEEKEIFKTFGEINPEVIIDQAGVRQQYIDQGQSLNLMIGNDLTPKEINELHLRAWKVGVKSLYYQHSTNAAQVLLREKNACKACQA